jgi:hypothetical protein
MPASVRNEHNLLFIGTDGRYLDLTSLLCDSNSASSVLGGCAVDRKLPNVGVTDRPGSDELSRAVHIRLAEGKIAERELPIAATVVLDDAQIEHRRIEQRAAP